MKQLVLLGGGHAHLHCLAAFAQTPIESAEITLISPFSRQVYSGMVPGWVAGHYRIDECVIPLAPLAEKANIAFRQTRAMTIDVAGKVVHCEDGSEHPFDILSADTGTVFDPNSLPGSAQHALSLRPLEDFIAKWPRAVEKLDALPAPHLAMIGGGAAGIEVLLSMQFARPRWRFTLVSGANTLPGSVGPRLARILKARGIALRAGTSATRVSAGAVQLGAGEMIEADAVVIATGATGGFPVLAPGLKREEAGFILIDEHLQSLSHPFLFAAGDCATMPAHPRPRSGVYAVRAGPPLAENLRQALAGKELVPHVPQPRSLYLISTGDRYAVASWGNWSWQGKWVWRWKDRIDRAFVQKYASGDS
jgi:pyridine nucleotide-disulfide oxidoreductase family protein